VDKKSIEQAVSVIIKAIGEDPAREGLVGTPRRIAEMYEELFAGLTQDPSQLLETGFDDEDHHEMVIVKDVPFYSMCVPSRQIIGAVGGAKRAAEVKVGDWLYTLDGGEVQTTRVVALSHRPARELVRVTPACSTPFFVTPEHPIMTPDGWREAADLNVGDRVEWTHPHRYAQWRYPIVEGYDLGYVLGAVGADASIQDGRRISLCVRERDYARRFARSFGRAFGRIPQIEPIKVPSGFLGMPVQMYRVRVVSSYIAGLMLKWFRCEGPMKETKRFRLPRGVLRSRVMTQGFLDGYIDGDGYDLPKTGRMIVSSNRRFLRDLAPVVGSRAALNRHNGLMHLYVSDRWHQPRWYGRRGFVPTSDTYDLRDSRWLDLAKVERCQADGAKPYTVYTFTCDPYPTFCIAGVLTHNCEHHFLPFHGMAHVGYIPQGRILGVSKVARLVEMLARKPQVQERLTSQIADFLCQGGLGAAGAGVVIEAEHLCMTARGVKKPGSRVVTSATRGVFRDDPRTRAEFLSILEGRRSL
jgi:GTP cyclohydrolase I